MGIIHFFPPECFVVQTTNRLIDKTINRLINHKSIILCCSPRHNQQTVSEWGSARPKRNHERGKKIFWIKMRTIPNSTNKRIMDKLHNRNYFRAYVLHYNYYYTLHHEMCQNKLWLISCFKIC